MPGILVGLGVLGTFLGLSLSLLQAFPLLTDQKLESAINILISGASVAFFTSVFGLGCSLLFNFCSDNKISILQKSLNEFNFSLEKSLKLVTEEHLLVRHLEELQQQSRHLDSMDERIALKMGDLFEQMGSKIQESISQGNQNISEKFLSDIIDKMNQGMGDFSKKQMENLDKTLNALQEYIPALILKLEKSQKENEEKTKEIIEYLTIISKDNQTQINELFIESAQNIKSVFQDITQNLKQGMNQTLSSSSGELRNLITSLGEINQKILQQTNESKTAYQDELNETAQKLHSFTDRLEKAVSEIKEVTDTNIRQALASFSQTIEQQKQIATKNNSYIDSLKSLTDSLKPIPSALLEMTSKTPELY